MLPHTRYVRSYPISPQATGNTVVRVPSYLMASGRTTADYCRILEVNTSASLQQIHRAYRRMVLIWHPDRFKSNPDLHAEAEEKLRVINEAYEFLKNHPPTTGSGPTNHSPSPPETPRSASTSYRQRTASSADARAASKESTTPPSSANRTVTVPDRAGGWPWVIAVAVLTVGIAIALLLRSSRQPSPSSISALSPQPVKVATRDGKQKLYDAIIRYNEAVASLSHGRGTVEDVLRAVHSVREVFYDTSLGDGVELGTLSEAQTKDFEHRLPGIHVWNGPDSAGVALDTKYLVELTLKYGTPTDRAFIEAYRLTYPVLESRMSYRDYTWCCMCTAYGSGNLTAAYANWFVFAEQHPGAFEQYVAENIEEIRMSLLESNCSCTKKEDVQQELQLFLSRFPNSSWSNAVRERLRRLLDGSLSMRFDCYPV